MALRIRGGSDDGFTLDAGLLAERQAATARRVHTFQIPAIRFGGFVILCVLAMLQDLRSGIPLGNWKLLQLVLGNLSYAAFSWLVLWRYYSADRRADLSLVFLHIDVLVWLANLHHLEQAQLFFAYFLLFRVADQVGFGFRRAFYFNHVVLLAYLGYSTWVWIFEPEHADVADRIALAASMYLLGIYLAFTGLVTERLRNRMRQAMRAARELVASLEQKKSALETQARELEEARALAEQASIAKSQFLAMISHEIRTPMNGVLGSTELLLATPLAGRQKRYAETAHRSGTALLALIDDVLDLSHIEASKLTLNCQVFDLRALVIEAVDLMSVTARAKPVSLRCSIPDALPPFMEGDPTRLRQVLVNLLHNAVKFTDTGHVVVDLAILEDLGAELRLRFEVRDTGIGLAADQFDSVFDAFTQGDASSTRRHGGSGLGLAIVKELAELMHGEVGVESQLGEGSTFWFQLVLKKADRLPADAHAQVDAHLAISAHVLLAEDDLVNQMVVEEMLTKIGCNVDVVGDGDAARAAAAQTRYDLIFMDCHMPVMDGFEATRRIREDAGAVGVHTPIVALTADALAGDRERCLASGMDDYMTKPVSVAQLDAAVRRWTMRQQAPASS
ncbi:MAG: ATP-binding protein [Caldimonas sp.]